MICSHCGKTLESDKLMFCVYCGYPLRGEKKGFFAKSEETGVSRAQEMAEASMPEMPSLDTPVQTAPMNGSPAVNTAKPASSVNAAVQTMTSPMGMQPMQAMQPGIAPMGTQPMMQPMGMQTMAMQQPAMPAGLAPMGAQPMMQGMTDMTGMPQMGYGMPQMGYAMPQMGYGMPQFAGYDAAGNPMYVQMIPQFMGYDAYGNPIYNMVAMPYVMPGMQGMGGVTPMMQPVYQQQEQVIDVPQEQIRPADPAPAVAVVQQPKPQTPAMQAAPIAPKVAAAPAVQQPVMQQAPAPTVQKSVIQSPAAPVPQSVMPQSPVAAPIPQPMAQQPAPPVQKAPIQSVQEAALAVQEALSFYQEAKPVPPSPYRSTQISSADDVPMDADTLMREDEQGKQSEEVPDEKALLDSIFSDAPKNYSMSEGTKPASAVFSINISANEITNVPVNEFGDDDAPPPPPVSLFSKPGVQIHPFSGPAVKETPIPPEPAPRPAAPAAKAAAPAPDPEPAPPKPRKTSKPRTEEDANAAKRAAKEQKLAREAKEAKEQKPAKQPAKKKPAKKSPAKIVSPDDFFEDNKHSNNNGVLSVKELENLDDEQLVAALSNMNNKNGGRKSTRSMKAASKEEMDISNIDVDAVLSGVSNPRLPN
ncbi:MAG: hypothetical protein K6F80_02930 [Oscillospiraceae bacterium]|nr:hypothetical protein [Oscillospiraceae bacterium]